MSPQTLKWIFRVAAVPMAMGSVISLREHRLLAGSSGLAFAVLWFADPLGGTPGSLGRKARVALIGVCLALALANIWFLVLA